MPLNYFNQFSNFLHGINTYLSLLSGPQYYALFWLVVAFGALLGLLLARSGLLDSAALSGVKFFGNLSGRFQALRDKLFARNEEADVQPEEEKADRPVVPAAPSAMIHVPAGQRSIESLALEFYILAKKEFIQDESLPRLEAEVPTLEEAIAYLAAKQPQALPSDVSVENF
jgi:hypothetical protein